MGYYLEIWLRGFAKDFLRGLSTKDEEDYHPHITLIRPFEIKTSEEEIKQKIISFCKGKSPIPFSLEGKGDFDGKVNYIPVVDYPKLLSFNDELENLLKGDVDFWKKLSDKKILHATVDFDKEINPCPRVDQNMLRLTVMREDRIWFSFDFVTQEALNREESLDKKRWYQTVHNFSKKYHLLPTRQGYKKI